MLTNDFYVFEGKDGAWLPYEFDAGELEEEEKEEKVPVERTEKNVKAPLG